MARHRPIVTLALLALLRLVSTTRLATAADQPALTLPNVDTILAEAQEVAERISEPATITRAYYLPRLPPRWPGRDASATAWRCWIESR